MRVLEYEADQFRHCDLADASPFVLRSSVPERHVGLRAGRSPQEAADWFFGRWYVLDELKHSLSDLRARPSVPVCAGDLTGQHVLPNGAFLLDDLQCHLPQFGRILAIKKTLLLAAHIGKLSRLIVAPF